MAGSFIFLRNCCLNAFTMVIVSKVLLMSYVNEGGGMVIGFICILNMFFLNLWYTSSADCSAINSCLFSLDVTADKMFTLHLHSSTQSNHKKCLKKEDVIYCTWLNPKRLFFFSLTWLQFQNILPMTMKSRYFRCSIFRNIASKTSAFVFTAHMTLIVRYRHIFQ